MSEIVVELKRRNWSDEKIGRELGMDPDEVLRLTQITGLAEMFSDRDFSLAWEAAESNEINEGDNLITHEENLSPLPIVGGLARGDVSGDTISDPSIGDRLIGETIADADAPKNGDGKSGEGVAESSSGEPEQYGQESAGVVGAGGMLPVDGSSGLPHETRMAHTNRKPAGRSKRRGRHNDS